MAHYELTGRAGEHVEVGRDSGGYWFALYRAGEKRPEVFVDSLPTVLDLMAASEGEIAWPRYQGLIRELVEASGLSHARAARHLAQALSG